MVSVRVLGFEVIAIGRTALWLSDRLREPQREYDSSVAHPTPVVFVHGFLGDWTNFHAIEAALTMRGVMNVAHFDYAPRFDWPRLATRLGHAVDRLRETTGSRRVDLVGHSLGGLVARYLVEMRPDVPVRRLVTLGSPYFGSPMPRNELAVFGASDPIVTAPHPTYGPHAPHLHAGGRAVVVPECGHWGLLVHERVVREVGRFLTSPDLALTHGDAPIGLERAS
jgi:pimeloyl-ACP methyl ester carboxylesterase